jgi:glutamine cyclotransferase
MTHQASPPSPSRRTISALIAAVLVLIGTALEIFLFLPDRPVASIPQELEARMTYEIVGRYPHDPRAFTQGLIYHEGTLYESTGLYGESSLRKVDLQTGEVLQRRSIPQEYFAEGLTIWQDTLIQLTWRAQIGFVYSLEGFTLREQFHYPTEGWGLTQDGQSLIMSDGTAALHFLDPDTLQKTGQVTVTYQGEEIYNLNELEFVLGEVYANIWQTDLIARIDPHTGEVIGWIDLAGLLPQADRTPETDVLNGIAYDPAADRLFLTGKKWPYLYEVRLVPAEVGE